METEDIYSDIEESECGETDINEPAFEKFLSLLNSKKTNKEFMCVVCEENTSTTGTHLNT